jgi:hypothetical protein
MALTYNSIHFTGHVVYGNVLVLRVAIYNFLGMWRGACSNASIICNSIVAVSGILTLNSYTTSAWYVRCPSSRSRSWTTEDDRTLPGLVGQSTPLAFARIQLLGLDHECRCRQQIHQRMHQTQQRTLEVWWTRIPPLFFRFIDSFLDTEYWWASHSEYFRSNTFRFRSKYFRWRPTGFLIVSFLMTRSPNTLRIFWYCVPKGHSPKWHESVSLPILLRSYILKLQASRFSMNWRLHQLPSFSLDIKVPSSPHYDQHSRHGYYSHTHDRIDDGRDRRCQSGTNGSITHTVRVCRNGHVSEWDI